MPDSENIEELTPTVEIEGPEPGPDDPAGDCLFPPCTRGVAVRGLCRNHYHEAYKLVRDGETSWEKLEAAGKAAPRKRHRFRDWLLDEVDK